MLKNFSVSKAWHVKHIVQVLIYAMDLARKKRAINDSMNRTIMDFGNIFNVNSCIMWLQVFNFELIIAKVLDFYSWCIPTKSQLLPARKFIQ